MRTLLAVALILVLLSPALAIAGSSTDAALALGAFAVFNQILSGTGVFGGFPARPVAAAPVVYAPAPPVVVAPPPRVIVAPPPPVVVVPPAPVVVAPGYYYAAPRAYRAPRHVVARGWCPPGHLKHGRCW